jgi:hypothetical protein
VQYRTLLSRWTSNLRHGGSRHNTTETGIREHVVASRPKRRRHLSSLTEWAARHMGPWGNTPKPPGTKSSQHPPTRPIIRDPGIAMEKITRTAATQHKSGQLRRRTSDGGIHSTKGGPDTFEHRSSSWASKILARTAVSKQDAMLNRLSSDPEDTFGPATRDTRNPDFNVPNIRIIETTHSTPGSPTKQAVSYASMKLSFKNVRLTELGNRITTCVLRHGSTVPEHLPS